MDRWQGKVAIVTGASAGIGAGIAKDLVEAGMKVVGLARRLEKMQENAKAVDRSKGGEFYAIKCDMANEEEILEAFAWVKSNLGGVDVLVNNAGILKATMLSTPDNTAILRSTLDVNVIALCICTREALISMKERNVAGHIIHINSIVGHKVPFLVPPNENIYAGTKHCVTAMTEILRQELIYTNSKTKVTSLSPGIVKTELETYLEPGACKQYLAENLALEPKDVSQAVLYVLGTPEHVQVHELIIKPIGEKL